MLAYSLGLAVDVNSFFAFSTPKTSDIGFDFLPPKPKETPKPVATPQPTPVVQQPTPFPTAVKTPSGDPFDDDDIDFTPVPAPVVQPPPVKVEPVVEPLPTPTPPLVTPPASAEDDPFADPVPPKIVVPEEQKPISVIDEFVKSESLSTGPLATPDAFYSDEEDQDELIIVPPGMSPPSRFQHRGFFGPWLMLFFKRRQLEVS